MSLPRSSRRPRPFRGIVFALAVGLAATLFIAWPLTSVLLYYGVIRHQYGGRFPVETPSGLGSITVSLHTLSDAYQLRLVQPEDSFLPLGDPARLPRWVAVPPGPEPALVYVDTGASGWPLRCFASESWQRRTNSGTPDSPRYAWREQLRHNILLATTPSGRIFLPLRPIWTGLIGDTLLFGACAWLGVAAVTGLRSYRRRRRGGCPECGYDLSATPNTSPCPECGRMAVAAVAKAASADRGRLVRAAFVPALIISCAAWAVWVGPFRLLALRELLRLGEAAGITPTAASGQGYLAGQILGFNYSRPPAWYDLAARAAAFAIMGAPVFAASLLLHRGSRSRERVAPTPWRRTFAMFALSMAVAGGVFAALDRWLGDWLFLRLLALGEAAGGSVSRLSGAINMTPDGPFAGHTVADSLANRLVRAGLIFLPSLAAFTAAYVLHTRFWRTAHAAAHLCPACGYDLSATPNTSPCPECGRRRPDAPAQPPAPAR